MGRGGDCRARVCQAVSRMTLGDLVPPPKTRRREVARADSRAHSWTSPRRRPRPGLTAHATSIATGHVTPSIVRRTFSLRVPLIRRLSSRQVPAAASAGLPVDGRSGPRRLVPRRGHAQACDSWPLIAARGLKFSLFFSPTCSGDEQDRRELKRAARCGFYFSEIQSLVFPLSRR